MSVGAKTGWVTGHRKEQRISACKPVTVSGRDAFGNSFSQNTFTVEIAPTGARLRGLPPLKLDTPLFVEHAGQQARYRVVWIGAKDSHYDGHVGLECTDPGKSIFGIEPSSSATFYDEYKRVEAELERSDNRYKRLFENSLGLICTHDMQGSLLSLNPAAARCLGYEPSNVQRRYLGDFLAPSVRHLFPHYLRRIRERGHDSGQMLVVARNKLKRVWLYRNVIVHEPGNSPYVLGHAMDVTEQKQIEHRLETTLKRLKEALVEVKTLRGLLPICSWCKKIRTENGAWSDLETYISAHSDARFSHGICPECRTDIK